jgi:hypothetical protein
MIENVSQQPWEHTMKNLGFGLAVASLLLLAACSGGDDAGSTTPAGGGSGPADTARTAAAPADGTVVVLDVSGMT